MNDSQVTEGVKALKRQYIVELTRLGGRCAAIHADLEEWLGMHHFRDSGRTIPFVLMPYFISPAQARLVERVVAILTPLLDRFCDAYCEDGRVREELALPKAEDALVRIDPHFPHPVRICRLDAFLDGYDIKFLEFNADSPAGAGWCDVLFEGLRLSVDLPKVKREFHTVYTPILPTVIGTLLGSYYALRKRHRDLPAHPRLAVVDIAGTPTLAEFRLVASAACEAGLHVVVATLDELSYDGSRLFAHGQPVELVYRRALVHEIGDTDLAAAARDGRVGVVNPFRSKVAGNKKLLALLQDPRFRYLIGAAETEVIRASIPWTRILRPGPAIYGGRRVDLLEFVSNHREWLVMKPSSDCSGRGVMLGNATEQATWDAAIEAHTEGGNFIVQQYVPIPEEMFPTVKEGRVETTVKRVNISPFAIGGRCAGMLTRISDDAVINVAAGGGILPTVVARHRGDWPATKA
jgi:hypothetical protein